MRGPLHERLNLPDPAEGYAQLCVAVKIFGQHDWRGVSPAVYHAWRRMDAWRWSRLRLATREQTEKRKFGMFKRSYRAALGHAARGNDFAPVPDYLAPEIEHLAALKPTKRGGDELKKIKEIFKHE